MATTCWRARRCWLRREPQWLGVTSTEEGVAVRAVCPQPRILLMSGIFRGEAETVIDQGLTPVVWEPWHLDLLEEAAAARGMPPVSIAVHLEIDTGMSRQGVRVVGRCAALLPRFHAGSCLRLEGVMTHFCCAGNHVFRSAQSAVGEPGDRAAVDG